MACIDTVCGTGEWTGPLPGDPDNNSILTATPAYGGIDVAWTLPSINTFAVSHTQVFRGISSDFSLATLRTTSGGSAFYDRIPQAEIQEYFYWIRIVSVHGTLGDPIGPASATPKALIEETIENLTGLIDAGVLAESLRSEIGRIEILNQRIYQEEADRKEQHNYLTTALSEVQADGDALTALLQEEVLLRISNNEALAASITTTQAELDGNLASVQTTMQSNINTVNGKVTAIGALYTAKVDVNGLVGGFGVYNDGTTVEAGFDVDRFWIGRTTNKRKPFIIENNIVYIDEGAINKLTFSKLRDESGSFVVENGKVKASYIDANNLNVRGQVNVGAFTSYAWPAAGLGGAHLSSTGFAIGNATNGGKYFHIASGYGTGGNAVITTNIPAYLETAQIKSAHIDALQVSTLHIKNNSITVSAIQNYSTVIGTGDSWVTVASIQLAFTTAPYGVMVMFSVDGPQHIRTGVLGFGEGSYGDGAYIRYRIRRSTDNAIVYISQAADVPAPLGTWKIRESFATTIGVGTVWYYLDILQLYDEDYNRSGYLYAMGTLR